MTKNENKYKGWVTPIVETCTYSLSYKERSVLFVFWLLVYLSILLNSNCLLILSRPTAILWCICTMQLFDCLNFLQGSKFYTWKRGLEILWTRWSWLLRAVVPNVLRRNVDKITVPTLAFIVLPLYAWILFLFIQGSFLPSFFPMTVQLGRGVVRERKKNVRPFYSYGPIFGEKWLLVLLILMELLPITASTFFSQYNIDKFWKLGHLSLILDWLMLNVDVALFQHIYILILLYTSEH